MIKLFARLGLLALLVLPLQIAAGNLMEDRSFRSRERLDEILSEHADTVIIGDSTMHYRNPMEPDQRTLFTMMAELLPDRKTRLFQGDGGHLSIFESHVQYLCQSTSRPKEVVICLNLRSFSPIWDQKPGLQSRVEILRYAWGDLLALGLLRPLSTFGIYKMNPLTLEEWGNLRLYRGDQPWGTIAESQLGTGPLARKSVAERRFTMSYMNPVPSSHRKLASLQRLVRRCREAGVRPVFYLTPLDGDSGTRAVGQDFLPQIRRNVAMVKELLQKEGVPLLDLSEALHAEDFDWLREGNPNEHLMSRGRSLVAKEVARVLLEPESKSGKPAGP